MPSFINYVLNDDDFLPSASSVNCGGLGRPWAALKDFFK